MLKRGKYKIKVLNTINFAKSMHYNPFAYIRSEKDILKLVNTIIVNTKGEGQQSGDEKKERPSLKERLAEKKNDVMKMDADRKQPTADKKKEAVI